MRRAVLLSLAGLLPLAPRVESANSIVGSRHDLSTATTSQVCQFCHTPHKANTNVQGPLWNRFQDPSTSFTLYTSSTMDMTVGQPGATSKLCLSCHDGVNATGVDSNGFTGSTKHDLVKPPGAGMPDTTSSPNCERCHTSIYYGRPAKWLGTDLSNDHPVGLTYPTPSDDPEFKTPPDVQNGWGGGNIRLVGGKIECVTCHNVHSTQYPPFLVKSNTGSAICVTCHDK